MRIFYSKLAVKVINNMESSIRKRIKSGIEGLLEVPQLGDVKQLRGVKYPTYHLRIGKYRIIYEYMRLNNEEVLVIKDIGSRGDIYK